MAYITEEDYRKTKGYAYAKWLEENEEFLKNLEIFEGIPVDK